MNNFRDIPSMNFKTGIANRALRPTLGIVDTQNTDTCPTAVHISAGLDVVRIYSYIRLGMLRPDGRLC